MKTNITESDVEKVKNSTKILLKDDNIDLSYITTDLLTEPVVPIKGDSLEMSYQGNRLFYTADPKTAEQLFGFYSDKNGQDPCGEILMYIPSALYTVVDQSHCFGTNFKNYLFTHK